MERERGKEVGRVRGRCVPVATLICTLAALSVHSFCDTADSTSRSFGSSRKSALDNSITEECRPRKLA